MLLLFEGLLGRSLGSGLPALVGQLGQVVREIDRRLNSFAFAEPALSNESRQVTGAHTPVEVVGAGMEQ
jgi:hypothetical protein